METSENGVNVLNLPLLQPVHVEMDAICEAHRSAHGRDIKVEHGAGLPSLAFPQRARVAKVHFPSVVCIWGRINRAVELFCRRLQVGKEIAVF
jgi:hypothetical protein